MPSAVVGQPGAQGLQKTVSKATVETADTSKVPASVKVRNCSSSSRRRAPHRASIVCVGLY